MQITHPELVRALAKPGEAIKQQLTADDCHLLHMMLGIMGEVGELSEALEKTDLVNIKEELGDLYWYAQGVAQSLEVLLPLDTSTAEWNHDLFRFFQTLIERSGILADAIKRVVIYRKDEEIRADTLCQFVLVLDDLAHGCGFTREQCLDANIAKLKVRYDKLTYSDADAQARKDKQ